MAYRWKTTLQEQNEAAEYSKEYRQKNDLSQRELARKLHVAEGYISLLENGKGRGSGSLVKQLLKMKQAEEEGEVDFL